MTTSYLFYGDRQDGPEGLLAMTTSTSNSNYLHEYG